MGGANLVAEHAAEHDEAVLDEPVHEGRVLGPAGLLFERLRMVVLGARSGGGRRGTSSRRLDRKRTVELEVAVGHEVRRRGHVQPQRAIGGAVDHGGEPGGRARVGERDHPGRAAADARVPQDVGVGRPRAPRRLAARAGPGAAASGATARRPGRGPSAACRARSRRRRRGSGTRPRSAPSSSRSSAGRRSGPSEATRRRRGSSASASRGRRGPRSPPPDGSRAGISKSTGLLPLSRTSTCAGRGAAAE